MSPTATDATPEEVLNGIPDALEERGYVSMANGRDIGMLLDQGGLALPTDTRYKSATFIETYTGRAFWPLSPTPEAISIIDIAHALSNQCRYSGHVRFFYSVAQHCCLLAQWLEANGGSALDCLQILMHDAPEGYLVDIPRPVKQYMPEYRVWDHRINEAIRQWMGWTDLELPTRQDELD